MKKTQKVIAIMIVVAIVMGVNISNAFSFNANLSSNDKLVAGKEVKITLSLSSINMDEGIRSIKVGKITVGEEFEPVSSTSFSSSTWMPTYSKGGLVLMSGTPVKNEGVAVTLTLKVKPGVTAKSSTIKFENIVASSGLKTGDIAVGTKTITVKANDTATSGNNTSTNGNGNGSGSTDKTNTENGTNQGTQGNTNNTTKKPTSSQKTQESSNDTIKKPTSSQATQKNNNTTEKSTSSRANLTKLPKAGEFNYSSIFIIIISIIALVAGIFFLKIRRLNKKIK